LSPHKTTQKKIKHPLPCTRLLHRKRKTGVVKLGMIDNEPRKKLHRLGKVVHKETEMIGFFHIDTDNAPSFCMTHKSKIPQLGGWEIHFAE
jgi:hypothetical protein